MQDVRVHAGCRVRLRELPRVRPDALPRIRNRESTRQPFFLEPFGATTSTRGTTRWMKACQLLPGIAYEHLAMYHYQTHLMLPASHGFGGETWTRPF